MTNGNAPGEVDAILDRLEQAAKEIETTRDVLAAPKVEQDLLQQLENLQNSLEGAQQAGDSSAFGGDCARIGRARAVLEGLRFETQSQADECRKQVLRSCELVERDLQAAGLSDKLQTAQDSQRAALVDRLRKELACEMQIEDEDEWDKMSEVWDDHPGQAQQMPNVQFFGTEPAAICGHLWKKSPSPAFPIKQWKWRWVTLAEGKMKWYVSEADEKSGNRKCLRGEIDFHLNPCSVSLENGDSQFSVRPHAGKWILGSFTGAEAGREFYFDSIGSQHARDRWVGALKLHMRHGGQAYGGTRLSFMGK